MGALANSVLSWTYTHRYILTGTRYAHTPKTAQKHTLRLRTSLIFWLFASSLGVSSSTSSRPRATTLLALIFFPLDAWCVCWGDLFATSLIVSFDVDGMMLLLRGWREGRCQVNGGGGERDGGWFHACFAARIGRRHHDPVPTLLVDTPLYCIRAKRWNVRQHMPVYIYSVVCWHESFVCTLSWRSGKRFCMCLSHFHEKLSVCASLTVAFLFVSFCHIHRLTLRHRPGKE